MKNGHCLGAELHDNRPNWRANALAKRAQKTEGACPAGGEAFSLFLHTIDLYTSVWYASPGSFPHSFDSFDSTCLPSNWAIIQFVFQVRTSRRNSISVNKPRINTSLPSACRCTQLHDKSLTAVPATKSRIAVSAGSWRFSSLHATSPPV